MKVEKCDIRLGSKLSSYIAGCFLKLQMTEYVTCSAVSVAVVYHTKTNG